MAHRVCVTTSTIDITKAGSAVTVEIFETRPGNDKEEKLGEIEIGQGSFGWKIRKGRNFKRIPWARLFNILEATKD